MCKCVAAGSKSAVPAARYNVRPHGLPEVPTGYRSLVALGSWQAKQQLLSVMVTGQQATGSGDELLK